MSGSCGCEHCHENGHQSENGKIKLVRIIVSAIVLIAVWILDERTDFFSSVPSALFYAAAYLIAGYDVLIGAVKNIFKGKVFDENFLMTVASLGAFAIGEYTEAVAVMIFNQIGEMFEEYAVGKSHRSIAALTDIIPEHAAVIRNGKTVSVSPAEVKVGEMITVRAGDRIPLDGVVVQGGSMLDTAALTGESKPAYVSVGDEVLSGCVNLSGLIKVKVTKEYKNSTVARIMELVENAGEKKTRAENFITKFARFYTPVVVGTAVLVFAIPGLVTGDWQNWLRRALVFLVVSCPCALVVSVPLSFFSGIGAASKKGILIKGSNYIDALSKVKTVAFDKTGTLTEGEFSVTRVIPDGMSGEKLLGLAAACEDGSAHPIARSIVKAWNKPVEAALVESLQEISGEGVVATADGNKVSIGNKKLMERAGAKPADFEGEGTAVYVAVGSSYAGCILVSDKVKENSAQAVFRLKKLGIQKTVMLTGDNEKTAAYVANKLGVDGFYAGLLPADKVERVEELLEGGSLAFVGDGINDAPVLARADVGIAMGAGGSDAAIEAADIVLMDGNPEKVALAVKIARRTMNIVRQNIVFALGIKIAVMILGAVGLAGMWAAVFADVGVLVLAVLNSIRGLKVPADGNDS